MRLPGYRSVVPGQIIGYRTDGRPIRLQAGGAGPAVVQHAGTSATFTSGTTATLAPAFAANVTAGNCVAALFTIFEESSGNPTVTSLTSAGSADNWAQAATVNIFGSAWEPLGAWADPNSAGGFKIVDINVTWGSAPTTSFSNLIIADIFEISGVAAASVVDTASVFTTQGPASNTTSWSVGASAATAQASELWLGMTGFVIAGANTTTTMTGPSSPWNNQTALNASYQSGGTGTANKGFVYQQAGYQVASATGTITYAGTSTATGTYGGIILPLKAPSALQGPRIITQAVRRASLY